MNTEDEEFLSRLLDTFKEEAQDHMQAIINGVLTLEKIVDSSQHSYIESVFRATHSLKGAARAVDFRDIELVCQNLESVFVAVRDQKITLQPDDFDLIHDVIATLEGLLIGNRKIKTGNLVIELKNIASRSKKEKFLEIPSEKPVNEVEQQDRELQELKLNEDLNSDDLSELNTGSSTSTIRISEDRIRSLYVATDDLLSLKLTSASHIEDIRKISRLLQTWRWNLFNNMGDINSLKRNGHDERTLEKIITFVEDTKEILKTCETGLSSLVRSINQEQFGMNLVISGLIESIREIVLVPVSSLTDSLPRIIRDIARENNKEVDIVINGSDIEIDRRILEAVKDPIIHIIRNSVDHGIEPQPVRIERNKSATGVIRIEITHARAHQITVRISDDGQGLDPDTITSAAIRKGIVTEESTKSMDNEEVMQLIFRSGLSTSEKVTSVSGRGLGLAIAREKINQVGGNIKIESITGVGTTFILILPVSLATFQGVLIYAENRPFFLPLQRIERVLFLKPELISTVEGRMVYNYEEYIIPVGHLGQILGIPEIIKEKNKRRVMVIIRHQGKYTGIIVDRVAGSQEIIVRDLGPQIRSVHLISGVTILDNNFCCSCIKH